MLPRNREMVMKKKFNVAANFRMNSKAYVPDGHSDG